MVDPIQRNLVATAGGAHTAQPVLSGAENLGTAIELTNISFFVPGTAAAAPGSDGAIPGSVGDGTYENPYQGMTQPNVDDGNAQNNRIFYINSGTYQAQYTLAEDPNFILLNNDQLFGRTDYFKQEAYGSSRPLINFSESGFEVPLGDTNDSFSDLQLSGSGSGAGIFVNHDSTDPTAPDINVNINGLSVTSFGDGIDILNGDSSEVNTGFGNATVSITNSSITNNIGVGGALLLPSINGVSGGIAAINFGNQLILNVDQTTVANNTLDNVDFLSVLGGIAVDNIASGSLILNVNNTSIVNNSEPDCSAAPCDNTFSAVGGIAATNDFLSNQLIVNVNNSLIADQMAINSSASATAGIAVVTRGKEATLDVNNSQVINNTMSNSSFISGGISVVNFGSSLATSDSILTANVKNSTISGNMINGEGEESGGISVENDSSDVGPFSSITSVNVVNSVIANNMVGEATVVGGIVVENVNGSTTLTVNNSRVTNNTESNSFTAAAMGGIAIFNQDFDSSALITANVQNSVISGNVATGGANASGGIAVNENSFFDNGSIILNVVNSQVVNNVGMSSGVGAAGGIAASHSGATGQLTVNVIDSAILGNTGSGADVGGGIAVENEETSTEQTTQINVVGSNISNNIGTNNNNGGGGIALEGDADLSTLTLSVSQSTLSNNQGTGVFALQTAGTLNATIDSSSVFGNTTGLDMEGNGTIAVTNPVFFDGIVNFGGGGTVTFPDVAPSSGQTVLCLLGTCTIQP